MKLSPDSVGKFVALGGTYHTHTQEKGRSYRWPDLWVVPEEGIITENETIQIPEKVKNVKPGSELTAVIGQDIWQADEDEAWDAVKGFTISNDVTSSGEWPVISDPNHGGSGVGYKLFPTFSPVLTEYQPKENLNAYDDLDVKVSVDDETAVSGSTAQFAFSIPEMISFASQIVKLNGNDLVALGDPGNPSLFLDDATEVMCYIESIGELRNTIES